MVLEHSKNYQKNHFGQFGHMGKTELLFFGWKFS